MIEGDGVACFHLLWAWARNQRRVGLAFLARLDVAAAAGAAGAAVNAAAAAAAADTASLVHLDTAPAPVPAPAPVVAGNDDTGSDRCG